MTEREGASGSRLSAALQLLKQVPERRREDAERGQRRFLAELEALQAREQHTTPEGQRGGTLIARYQHLKEILAMKLNHQKLAMTAALAVVMAVVFLFGGAAVTAYASQLALPGDALYPVKTRLEQTRASLSPDAAIRAQMYMGFAQRRLDEITLLIADGRVNDIEEATGEFEYYVSKAMEALQLVAANNPEKAADLAQEIFKALQEYAQALNDMAATLPDPARQAIQQAIMNSQSMESSEDGEDGEKQELVGVVEALTADTLVVDGVTFHIDGNSEIDEAVSVGSTVKVEYYVNEDGSFSLHEVEVDDDLNGNENENQNENESEDENENESEDENENEAENENEDDEDGENENANSNENDDDEDESGSNDNESHDDVDDDKDEDHSDEDGGSDDESDDSGGDFEDD